MVSEACNIGLAPVVNPGYEALTRARLVHVDQYYLRADTVTAANARLIAAQAGIPIVRYWGDGLLASVDGLRFQVPVRTINAARRRSTSGSSGASPGSTPSTTRSRASGRWSSPAPRATPCTSWMRC